MPRFDVYRLDETMVVDVQTDYLPEISTRLVVPLQTVPNAPRRTPRLNPVLTLGEQRLVFIPQQMASVPLNKLRDKVGSLSKQSDEILDAVYVLLAGF